MTKIEPYDLRTLYFLGKEGPRVVSVNGDSSKFPSDLLDAGYITRFVVAKSGTWGNALTASGAAVFCDAMQVKTPEEAIEKYETTDFQGKCHY